MVLDAEGKEIIEAVVVIDPIVEKDKEISELKVVVENYKNVALKRLGKLPGDADFVAGTDPVTGLTVEETVKKTLLEQKLLKTEEERNSEVVKLTKENSELKLALKNQPGGGLGSDGGVTTEVKDNVFSKEQLVVLAAKAKSLGADPEKFIAKAKENFLAKR